MKVFSLLAFLACLGFYAAAQEVPVLNLGHVGHDHHLAIYLACDLGQTLENETSGKVYLKKVKDKQVYYLMKNGKEIAQINLTKVGGGSKMPQALAAGQIDIGFGGAAPAIFAIDKGAKLKIIAPANADGDMLVVRNDLPVNNWREFVNHLKTQDKHLKIGCKDSKSVAVLIFMAALKDEGISYCPPGTAIQKIRPAVDIINLGKGSNMLPALKNGSVDGFVMNQPVPAQVTTLKLGKAICNLRDLPPEGKWHSHPCCCVAAHENTLKNFPEQTRALLDIFDAALKRLSDPQTEEIVARWTGMPLEVEKNSVPTNLFLSRADKDWNKGMDNWFELMMYIQPFNGSLKDVPTLEMHGKVSDYSFLPPIEKKK